MRKLLELAADVLIGVRIKPPPQIAADLPRGVTIRRNRLIPAVGGRLSRLGGSAAAVALPGIIVVHPRTQITPRLLAHEAVHIRQWRRDLLFPVRYTVETLRRGYRDNIYEREARAAEVLTEINPRT